VIFIRKILTCSILLCGLSFSWFLSLDLTTVGVFVYIYGHESCLDLKLNLCLFRMRCVAVVLLRFICGFCDK